MSVLIKLANVGIEDSEQYARRPEMWVRGNHQVYIMHDQHHRSFTLREQGSYDFLTFFNSLSLRKWDRYTTASDYELHLSISGHAKIKLNWADAYTLRPSYYPEDVSATYEVTTGFNEFEGLVIKVPAPQVNQHGTVPVLVGFEIETFDHTVAVRHAAWYAHVAEKNIHPVKLAVCTTTFKKEKYILANIAKVRNSILYGTHEDYVRDAQEPWYDEISDNFILNVVDNGRTLDVAAVEGNGVHVFPNPNVGGAGGFARGMMEAQKQDGVTHVLLMDDDVIFSTESFVRTYNVLRIVKDEYKNAFVSGAMMSALDPDILSEDTGFMSYRGIFVPVKPTGNMSYLGDVVRNESFVPPLYRKDCLDGTQNYAAWWFCGIPMTEVNKRGLPLPVFVRGDDVEYSLRDLNDGNRKFITMNGINVWHEPFFIRYDSAVERYQITRNTLVISHASGVAPLSDFIGLAKQNFYLELRRLNYLDARLVLEGLEDFLAGPDVVFAPGFAEKAFLRAHKVCERTIAWEDAKPQLKALGIDVDQIEPFDVLHDYKRSYATRAYDAFTLNGHRDPLKKDAGVSNDKVVVMERQNGSYQPGTIHKADVIVAVDIQNKKVAIRRRDNSQYKELMARFNRDMREYRQRKEELTKLYREAGQRMRTYDAWVEYLGL